jgi:hypothetical protein
LGIDDKRKNMVFVDKDEVGVIGADLQDLFNIKFSIEEVG